MLTVTFSLYRGQLAQTSKIEKEKFFIASVDWPSSQHGANVNLRVMSMELSLEVVKCQM